jgi:KDO2-lipid IV(A) lauroyltransferase
MLTLVDGAVLALVSTLTVTVRVLPEPLAELLARGILAIALLLIPRAKGVAMRNLEIAFPEMTVTERAKIYLRSLHVLARNFMWFAKIPTLRRERLEQTIDYNWVRELFDGARNQGEGKGVLLLTAHYGCFELFSNTHALLARPLTVLARDFTLPRFNRWWWHRRELCGNRIFSRKGGLREMIRCLELGEDVGILFDQNVKANHATFIDFFGMKAATSKPVGIAALKTGAPVVFGVGLELAPGRYRFIGKQIPNPRTFPGSPDEQIDAFLRAVHEEMEVAIREHPEQWMWLHRRFKTRPLGEKEGVYPS